MYIPLDAMGLRRVVEELEAINAEGE